MSNPYAITDEMVDDIVTTAMEGGSNYWTVRVDVIGGFPDCESTMFPGTTDLFASECLTKGRDLAWVEYVGDGEPAKRHTLTLAKMKRGIKKAAAHFGKTPLAFYEDHDAGDADVAVQLAILGEIVYG
jgi:hypothetical protein